MAVPVRRVRKLALRAPREELVRRGVLLLEDALHTASLPDPGGRLLIIRSLDVGTIRGSQSAASVALAVEQRMAALAPSAVHAAAPEAEWAPAVYFRDAVEPYVLLAQRLAWHGRAGGWFWPLVVPGWRPALARDDGLRLALAGAVQAGPGAAGVVALVSELHQQALLDPLLAALRPSDGSWLLRSAGWSMPAPRSDRAPPAAGSAPSGEAGPAWPAAWMGLLARWVARWGSQDARAHWLAAIALVAEQPARLMDHRLPARAAGVLRQIIASHASEPPAALAPSLPPLPRSGAPPRHAAGSAGVDEPAPPRRTGAASATRPLESEKEAGRSAGEQTPWNGGRPLPGSPGEQRLEMPPVPGPPDGLEPHLQESEPRRQWSGLVVEQQPSAYAGFWLLVPALLRLGMGPFLAAAPDLVDTGFPACLLRYAARRLRLPPADPTLEPLQAMAAPEPAGQDAPSAPAEFIAPPSWLVLGEPEALAIHRLRAAPGVRVLTDGTEQLYLALWRGHPPERLRELVRGRALRRGRPLPPAPGLELLLRAWLAAAGRYCWRFAGLGLAELVARPGRISATRTHIDIFFQLSQADIRVRKAGLDADPGWVPWLGRVVLFHYLDEEQASENLLLDEGRR